MFGCLAIIHRNERDFELFGPRSCVYLMNEGGHANKATTMDMKDKFLWDVGGFVGTKIN